MSENPKRFYEFGPFRLDEAERRLLRDGAEVRLSQGEKEARLPGKALDVLLSLVRSGGRMVRREQLLEEVWQDAFVEDNRLSDNVSTLRKALGDSSREPRFIETVPGLGYRFLADVREVEEDGPGLLVAESRRTHLVVEEDMPEPLAAAPAAAPPEVLLPAAGPNRSRLVWAAAACLLAVLVAGYFFTRVGTRAPARPAQFESLAVLPFKSLGATAPGGEDEYLGQGLADALITRLSNLRQVAVRPTSAVLKYGGATRPDLVAVAREQRVDAVLDGSLQRVGDRVRVTVQLVGEADGAPLWAETFDEKFTDMFAVQDAISARVAEALRLRLSGEEERRLARRQTQNPEAYQHYLRGRYHWNRRTADGMQRAVEYLSEAVRLDRSYALAHAGLADAYALLAEYANAPFHESMSKAREAALKALELDNSLAEAHVSLAYIKQSEWDWTGVEEEYRRGLELNPNYATGHQWYSEYLTFQGRTDEALREIRRAQQLDPLSIIVNVRVGMTLYYARRYDEAVEHLRQALEFDPDFILTNIFLYSSLHEKGAYREEIPHLVRGFFHVYPPEERAKIEAALTRAYEAGGVRGLLVKVRDLLESGERRDYNHEYSLAETYMRLGDRDAAFLRLNKAADVRHPGVAALKVAPAMDVLRDDPRFAELLRRVNLPQ